MQYVTINYHEKEITPISENRPLIHFYKKLIIELMKETKIQELQINALPMVDFTKNRLKNHFGSYINFEQIYGKTFLIKCWQKN